MESSGKIFMIGSQKRIVRKLVVVAGLVACILTAVPASAFVGGAAGAIDAATTAAVAGWGASAATSATDDDGD